IFQDHVPFEAIRWKSHWLGDEDLSSAAKHFPEYKVSLDPNGSILLPSFKNDEMVGPVTDLNTFYVALSQTLGISKLHQTGDLYFNQQLIRGDIRRHNEKSIKPNNEI
ncbi:MAG: hypothetical protein L3J46_03130, partial [Kangiellaceae bacterium]|nr:hypothetical protein [Kangiellaceae bacterium]